MTPIDKDDKLITAHAEDALRIAEAHYTVETVGFLNPRQRTLISKELYPLPDISLEFFGGYPEAERTLLICRPEYADFSPDDVISTIRITGRGLDALTHRDILGSLMGLGIVRENIGDIVVGDGEAFVFVKNRIADYIVQNLTKIGRLGIHCSICKCSEAKLPPPTVREIHGTVSSMRLDAVLAFAAGISRSRAAELISQGLVSVNFNITESASAHIDEGDLISARGIGRIKIGSISGPTRKGRLGITALKYE